MAWPFLEANACLRPVRGRDIEISLMILMPRGNDRGGFVFAMHEENDFISPQVRRSSFAAEVKGVAACCSAGRRCEAEQRSRSDLNI